MTSLQEIRVQLSAPETPVPIEEEKTYPLDRIAFFLGPQDQARGISLSTRVTCREGREREEFTTLSL